MDMHFAHTRVELDRARFVHIVNGKGTAVTCLAGDIWVTKDHSPQDIWLKANEVYRVPDGGHLVLNAFTKSEALISRPVAQPIGQPGPLADFFATLGAAARQHRPALAAWLRARGEGRSRAAPV